MYTNHILHPIVAKADTGSDPRVVSDEVAKAQHGTAVCEKSSPETHFFFFKNLVFICNPKQVSVF